MNLTTSRLLLRDFTADDWKDLFGYLSDPDVVYYEPYEPFTEDASKQEAKNRAKNKDFIAVCLRDTGKLIGNLYFARQEYDSYEIGYVFDKHYQHMGYATEAATAVIDHAFNELGAHRISACCNPENKASWHLMKRLHMRREGHLKKNCAFRSDPASGEKLWQDTYLYAVLKDEWQRKL